MEQFEVVLKTLEDKAKFFTKITAEDREKVKNWFTKQNGKTMQEKSFLARVKDAVETVDYDYWIANLEPSVADGKIYYAEGMDVGVGFSSDEWAQMAKEYSPERGSRLSKLQELFIWYALRIVNGLWTLDYVANDSSSAGNYRNAPGATFCMEKTGVIKCGGYSDGQGNSYKIVTYEDDFALIGGFYVNDGYNFPVAIVDFETHSYYPEDDGSGVLVLIK